MQICLMVNKLKLNISDFEFDVGTPTTPEVFQV